MVYLLSSAFLAAVVNFFMRRNFEKGGSSSAYLCLYFSASFFLSFLMNPQLLEGKVSSIMISLGAFAGGLNFIMMGLTAKTLQLGPPGLSFTFQNASSVFPAFFMYVLFGPTFGFGMSPGLCCSLICILLGLYLSTRTVGKETADQQQKAVFSKWLFCAISMLFVQGVILSIFQWRLLLLNESASQSHHWLIPWSCAADEEAWFVPSFFAVPMILQSFRFWRTEKRKFTLSEWGHGVSAGALNSIGTILLLLATKECGSLEKAMQFPLFTIAVIFFCNLWSWKIYKEKVNWKGIALCLLGVMIGFI